MKMLVIEHDHSASSVLPILDKKDFVLTAAETGEEGLYYATTFPYDLIVLDLALPDMPGFDVIAGIRNAKVDTPIFVVTSLKSHADVVCALDLGADRYLAKIFRREEFYALAIALVRRYRGYASGKIIVNDLVVDIRRKAVFVGETQVRLTWGKYLVLEALALRKGEVLAKSEIYDFLYGDLCADAKIQNVTVQICNLRKALSRASGGKNYIQTVTGEGYMLAVA